MLIGSKVKPLAKIFIGVLIVSLFLFLPLSKLSENLIEFKPFWFLETMMAFGDRLYWEKFYRAMTNYVAAKIYIKAVLAYGLALAIFIFGNLGTRIISGFWFFQKSRVQKRLTDIEAFLIALVLGGIILPMLFVQKGTAWNTIQFFYYSLFCLGIVSGVSLAKFLSSNTKMLFKRATTVILVLLTLPTTVATMQHYLAKKPQAKISKTELSALEFLSSQPQGVVLSLQIPGVGYDKLEFPIPLYQYDSTAYVSAFCRKSVYLEDVVNLNIMGYNWPARVKEIEIFLADTNSPRAAEFLKDANISYIYLVKRSGLGLHEPALNIKNIYDSSEAIVYKVLSSDVKY
jgi:hypothetical protein